MSFLISCSHTSPQNGKAERKSHTTYKLQSRSTPRVLLGYPSNHSGYKCLELSSRKIFIYRHVTFDKTVFLIFFTCSRILMLWIFFNTSNDPLPVHTLPRLTTYQSIHLNHNTPQINTTPPPIPSASTLPPSTPSHSTPIIHYLLKWPPDLNMAFSNHANFLISKLLLHPSSLPCQLTLWKTNMMLLLKIRCEI